MSEVAYVALGSNLGDRAAYLAAARSAISLITNVRLIAASTVEETAPIGATVQGPYLNQMVAIATELSPEGLLKDLQRIEQSLGRVRGTRWGPRTIDLDIVQYTGVHSSARALLLPHPGLSDRAFWQRERAELDCIMAS